MCRLHLDHLDHLEEMIARLDTQIEDMMQPFRSQRELLTTIPGIGPFAAAAVISEAGADIAETFPSPSRTNSPSSSGTCSPPTNPMPTSVPTTSTAE